MAYDKKTINKAENLYVMQQKSIREVADELKIARHATVWQWANKNNWEEKRNKIYAKADAKAEANAIEKIAKEKSEYRTENLKLTDLSKSVGSVFLAQLAELLRKDKTYALNEDYAKLYRTATSGLVTAIKQQDDMLFNKNKFEIEGNLKITANDIYSALLSDDRNEAVRDLGLGSSEEFAKENRSI